MKEGLKMKTYKVELENDNFEIITADTDEEAIKEALKMDGTIFNVTLVDDDYNEIKTIF
jgi:hypothetical protein